LEWKIFITSGELPPNRNLHDARELQNVLDMSSGLPTAMDFHTPGAPGYLYEIEQGMKPGKPGGQLNAIKETKTTFKPGEEWAYNDKNTDVLALLAEAVTGKPFPELLSGLFDKFGANNDGSIALTSDGTASPSYGISLSLRDYALFHQWLAEGKGPKSFYDSIRDESKKEIFEEKSKLLGQEMIYGSQTYYMTEHDVLYSQGSFGQNGYSDLKTGVSVVFMQDWATNLELEKYLECHERALAIINHLRAKSLPDATRGRTK
jgi:CubicO group peptidase (beta-lactamase class C family)